MTFDVTDLPAGKLVAGLLHPLISTSPVENHGKASLESLVSGPWMHIPGLKKNATLHSGGGFQEPGRSSPGERDLQYSILVPQNVSRIDGFHGPQRDVKHAATLHVSKIMGI